MEKIAKKGDILFVGEDDDTLAIIVLDTLNYKGDNYLKLVAMPIMVEKILDESKTESEFAREIIDGEKYLLDPVVDPEMIKTIKEEFKKKKASEKEQETEKA